MKKKISLLWLLSGMAACMVSVTGCVRQPEPPDSGGTVPGGGNGFDYATTFDVPLKVDYSMRGNKALFEVFAENPLVEKEGVLVRKEGVKSILKAYTDRDCKYAGVVDLPAAADKVWLYSESYGLPSCMAVDVKADGISFDLMEYYRQMRAAQSGKSVESGPSILGEDPTNPYNVETIGQWTLDGMPLYLIGELSPYGDNIEPYRAATPSGLMNRIQHVLVPGKDNSEYARDAQSVNIRVTKDAHLTLVFAAEMAAWHNAVGYYYYETKNPPKTQAEFDALPKFVAFPNCSSFTTNFDDLNDFGSSSNDGKASLLFGEQLRLKYFRNGKVTEVFPQGTTVGWFMLPDAYDFSYVTYKWNLDKTGTKHPARYSDSRFNADGEPSLVSLYDKESGKTILGFEDGGDKDFKDVLFYVDADPVEAIYDPDRPTTDPDDEQYPDLQGDPVEGTLAFEDLWPSQGDYDMNDVVVRYSTTFTTDKDNRITAIKDVFTPLHSGGTLKSAFGYQLAVPASAVKSMKITNSSSTAETSGSLETKQDRAVIMLFDDIHDAIAKGPVTVEIELDGSVSLDKATRKTLYNPFICVSADGFVPGALRKEIHLTNYAPTSLADPYPFGRNDDKSSVDKQGNPTGPYYYVTSDLHPFALDLPVTAYRIPDENMKIDDFYPDFGGWVTSKGEKNREWYLKPVK